MRDQYTSMQKIGDANPFFYAVDAARAMVSGHLSDISIIESFIIFAVLTILMLFWATNMMRKAVA